MVTAYPDVEMFHSDHSGDEPASATPVYLSNISYRQIAGTRAAWNPIWTHSWAFGCQVYAVWILGVNRSTAMIEWWRATVAQSLPNAHATTHLPYTTSRGLGDFQKHIYRVSAHGNVISRCAQPAGNCSSCILARSPNHCAKLYKH